MAHKHKDFALEFWRSFVQPKQKPPRFEILKGLLKAFAVATAVSFFTLAGFLRESPRPDPKLQPLLHASAGDESVAMLSR
jgi:hypothetical protein